MDKRRIFWLAVHVVTIFVKSVSNTTWDSPTQLIYTIEGKRESITCVSRVWRINDLIYGPYALPPPFTTNTQSNSIGFIANMSINGTMLQCLATNNVSSVFIIIVEQKETDMLGILNEQQATSFIRFDYQYLRLNISEKKLVWRTMNNVCSNLTFTLTVYNQCETVIPLKAYQPGPGISTFTISSENLTNSAGVPYLFEAQANGGVSCTENYQPKNFIIHPNDSVQVLNTFPNGNVCVPIHQNDLHAVWPVNGPMDHKDCSCTVYPTTPLNACHCINRTSYNVRYRTSDSENMICWENLTCDQNNTYLYFTTITRICSVQTEQFEGAWRVNIDELPPEVIIIHNETDLEDTICFNTSSSSCILDIPTYEFTVTDITQEVIFEDETFNCVRLPPLIPSCAPFLVSVTVINTSTSTSQPLPGYDQGTNCSCLQSKVTVNITATVTQSTSAEVTIKCSQLLGDFQALNITILLCPIEQGMEDCHKNTVLCTTNQTAPFNNLSPQTNYTVTSWLSGDCPVSGTINITTQAAHSDSGIPRVIILSVIVPILVVVLYWCTIYTICGSIICLRIRNKKEEKGTTV